MELSKERKEEFREELGMIQKIRKELEEEWMIMKEKLLGILKKGNKNGGEKEERGEGELTESIERKREELGGS